MSIEYRKEFGIEGKCRHGLAILDGCRSCLFEALCQYKHNQEQIKQINKSDLLTNK